MAPMGIGTIPAKMAGDGGSGEDAPSGAILCPLRACAEIGDWPESRCRTTRYPFRETL